MDQAILLIYAVTWAIGVLLPFLVLCTYRTCWAKLRSESPESPGWTEVTFSSEAFPCRMTKRQLQSRHCLCLYRQQTDFNL